MGGGGVVAPYPTCMYYAYICLHCFTFVYIVVFILTFTYTVGVNLPLYTLSFFIRHVVGVGKCSHEATRPYM